MAEIARKGQHETRLRHSACTAASGAPFAKHKMLKGHTTYHHLPA